MKNLFDEEIQKNTRNIKFILFFFFFKIINMTKTGENIEKKQTKNN